MADLVFGRDVAIGRLRGHNLAHTRLDDFLVLPECKKNGPDSCGLDISQLCPVLLLLSQCELMSLNSVLLVIIDRGQSDQTKLSVRAHGLLVDVHSLL